MAPRTIEMTREQLLERRARVLDDLRMSLPEFRNRVAHGALSGEEWDAVAELEEVAFLLDDTGADDDF